MSVEEPLGPRVLPVGSSTDEDFQELCHRLVHLEFPEARSPAVPDGGADSILPNPAGGFQRAWQAKRYTGTIYWAKCKESLDRAVRTYGGIERMTFCFARNLSDKQHAQFQKQLVGRHPGVLVDFWDLAEILLRLDSSEAGKRIARHYFTDSVRDRELMLRTIRGGGDLAPANKLIERALPIGETTARNDPFFEYPVHEFEEGSKVPLAHGTVMAFGQTYDGTTVRLDAVPRDPDAMVRYAPRLRFDFDRDELGERAESAMHEALAKHKAVTIDEGLEITFERVPPFFEDLVKSPSRGKVVITPQRIPAWQVVFRAATSRGSATFRMTLEPVTPPPRGVHVAFRGRRAGLTATVLGRWVEGRGGQIGVDWKHVFDDSPARDQAEALRFLSAMHGRGELTIADETGARPDIRRELVERPFDLDHFTSFLEDVVVIEDWVGHAIDLPDTVEGPESGWTSSIADAIRRRTLRMRWSGTQFVVGSDQAADMPARSAIRVLHELRLRLLGQEINLGCGILDVPEAEALDLGAFENDPARHRVELRPVGGHPLVAEWELQPPGYLRR